jgi:UDP-N-acetylmuramoylalanine-D-glutamate ligase
VTLTDRKPSIPQEAELRDAGIELELGEHDAASFESANLIVLSPGVPIDLPELLSARAAAFRSSASSSSRRVAARTHRRHHRHEREVNDDDAGRADARRRPAAASSSAATSATP